VAVSVRVLDRVGPLSAGGPPRWGACLRHPARLQVGFVLFRRGHPKITHLLFTLQARVEYPIWERRSTTSKTPSSSPCAMHRSFLWLLKEEEEEEEEELGSFADAFLAETWPCFLFECAREAHRAPLRLRGTGTGVLQLESGAKAQCNAALHG